MAWHRAFGGTGPGLALLWLLSVSLPAAAHPLLHPRTEATYRVAHPASPDPTRPRLVLHVREAGSERPVAARFTILIEGKPFHPVALGAHGLRFSSVQRDGSASLVLYARGTGPVELELPLRDAPAEVVVTRGLEFLPARLAFRVPGDARAVELHVELERWTDLRAEGWLGSDEHLHYARTKPIHDADWFSMLDADDLAYGFFMALEGGSRPGPWAGQFAYGEPGRARGERATLVPGAEFRSKLQGHHNLHGIAAAIHPLEVGRTERSPDWPPSHDLIRRVRKGGGIGGVAHAGSGRRASTAILDAVLGESEFFEIANTGFYELETWYALMRCGYLLAPVGGTDLPSRPYRHSSQPFLGETRTYVRIDAAATPDFEAWKQAVRAGRTFVTNGPIVSLRVAGAPLGQAVRLPEAGSVEVVAELGSPRQPRSLEIVRGGVPLSLPVQKLEDAQGVHRWRIEADVDVSESAWLAVRGSVAPLWAEHGGVAREIHAHSAAIPVLVGGREIFSAETAEALMGRLAREREVYAMRGRFPDEPARARMLGLFDTAIAKLAGRLRASRAVRGATGAAAEGGPAD